MFGETKENGEICSIKRKISWIRVKVLLNDRYGKALPNKKEMALLKKFLGKKYGHKGVDVFRKKMAINLHPDVQEYYHLVKLVKPKLLI